LKSTIWEIENPIYADNDDFMTRVQVGIIFFQKTWKVVIQDKKRIKSAK
jgi:hypothetical protein